MRNLSPERIVLNTNLESLYAIAMDFMNPDHSGITDTKTIELKGKGVVKQCETPSGVIIRFSDSSEDSQNTASKLGFMLLVTGPIPDSIDRRTDRGTVGWDKRIPTSGIVRSQLASRDEVYRNVPITGLDDTNTFVRGLSEILARDAVKLTQPVM